MTGCKQIMKSTTSKVLCLCAGLLLQSDPLLAMQKDLQQPIAIRSTEQSLDLKNHRVTFSGKVEITQGTIKIHADKVIVVQIDKQRGHEIIRAYGRPVSFYQLLENGTSISGHSQEVLYDIAKSLLTMEKEALIRQGDSQIMADRMSYNISQQKVDAKSEGAEPNVRITIDPAPLPSSSVKGR